MTEKLFYHDSHLKKFEANVVSCEQAGDLFKIVLDATVFFPEGGGQYADTGVLGSVNVLDVHEKNGVIYHTTDAPLEAGMKVHGEINWDERFEKMQQHTGEHIISGIVNERFGYQNVGFHLGSDYCTMDFNGPITKEELKEIELEANKAVFQNLDIEVSYPEKTILAQMEYRCKIEIEGQVRIVKVPGYDVCACCAPHVKKTGEIGLIKLVNMVNYKGGVRITMLCGFRALRDYDMKDGSTKEISALLCAKESETAEAVEHLKAAEASLKGKIANLQQKMMIYRAKEIDVTDDVTIVFDSEISGNGPRELMNLLLDKGAKISAVFAGTEKNGYRYVIGSRVCDVRPVSKKINTLFNGRGGGKTEMVQGSLSGNEDAIRKALQNS